jgi:ABC-2 type transport system ATP-binding protein
MPTPAISIQQLSKVFPIPFKRDKVIAVDDLSLTVEPGQVYGLLGPNGSGKSTTMKIVLGLVTPTAGNTEIFGCDSTRVASREQVGFLPENPYFYKFLTGFETLRFFGKLCGLAGKALSDRSKELLALVRLEGAADRRIGGYSKGMLQRIGLAQALIQEPRLLVLDEPTGWCGPRRFSRDPGSHPQLQRTRDHRAALLAFARASAGNLRSRWHSPSGKTYS